MQNSFEQFALGSIEPKIDLNLQASYYVFCIQSLIIGPSIGRKLFTLFNLTI